MQRPNKFLDAAALEQWANTFHLGTWEEWEYSDIVVFLDFWDWLERAHPDLLTDFAVYWRESDTLAEDKMKTWADVHRKARITIEIECAAPKEFFIPEWDVPEKFQEMIDKYGPLPCKGSGEMTTTCMTFCCHWLASYGWDSEPC